VRLQSLERELGATLLVRHGRGVDLTASGRLLLERGRRLLAEIDATGAAVRAVGEGRQGRLVLVLGRTVAPSLVGTILGELRRAAPDLTLDLAELSDSETLDRVRGGSTDAALLHLPPEGGASRAQLIAEERGYEVAVVNREPLVALLPSDHPQAAAERVDVTALQAQALVAPSRTQCPGLHEHAISAWRRSTDSAPTVLEADSVLAVLTLVRAGLGAALLPASTADVAWDGLVVRPLRQHAPPVDTGVAWRPAQDAPVLRRFLRIAMATPEPDVLGPAVARPHGGVTD
jgi:DNA-binding transcriptional LysR family regulator